MQHVKNLNDLLNFLSVVLVSAPDKFRQFDFLAEEDQMNLEKAFIELDNGLGFFDRKTGNKDVVARAHELLGKSLTAYRSGDKIRGAHFLQDFEELVFPE